MTAEWYQITEYREAVQVERVAERAERDQCSLEDGYCMALMDATAMDRFKAQKAEETRIAAMHYETATTAASHCRVALKASAEEPLVIPPAPAAQPYKSQVQRPYRAKFRIKAMREAAQMKENQGTLGITFLVREH